MSDTSNNEAGERLRRLIEERMAIQGIRSFRALAGKAAVQPITLTQWWTQGTTPTRATLSQIAPWLGVTVADLQAAYEGRSGPPLDLMALSSALRREVDRLSGLVARQERLAGLAAAAGAESARDEEEEQGPGVAESRADSRRRPPA